MSKTEILVRYCQLQAASSSKDSKGPVWWLGSVGLWTLLVLFPANGQAGVQIDTGNRTVTTNLIRVRWDLAHDERILSLEMNSNPGVNLTTYAGNDDFTGGALIAEGPRFTTTGADDIEWSSTVSEDGNLAYVVTKSQMADRAPMETIYRFEGDSSMILFCRKFIFSEVPFENTGKGLEPYDWYISGNYLPFTYSRTNGEPGKGVSSDFPASVTDWDGRWGDMVQITFFHKPGGYPTNLFGDRDGLFGSPIGPGCKISPTIAQKGTLSTDLTVYGALFLHATGLSPTEIEKAYEKFLAAVAEEENSSKSSFIRGDSNADGKVDLADAVRILLYLYLQGGEPDCIESADADDSREVDLADPVSLLAYFYLGGSPPPAPFPDCGEDLNPISLDCKAYPKCMSSK